MTRTLSWLAVVCVAVALAFTACPIQFDPDADLDIGDEGEGTGVESNFTGRGTGTMGGWHEPITVTIYWVDGVITNVVILQDEHPSVQHAIGLWQRWLEETNTFPPIVPPSPPLQAPPLDVFTEATISVNALTRAAQQAVTNRVADAD